MNKKIRRANIKKVRAKSINGIDRRLYVHTETSSMFEERGALYNVYIMKKVRQYVPPVDYIKPTPKVQPNDTGWEPAKPKTINPRRK